MLDSLLEKNIVKMKIFGCLEENGKFELLVALGFLSFFLGIFSRCKIDFIFCSF